jgi:predicted RecB family nuclease
VSNRLPGGGDENEHDHEHEHVHTVINDNLCSTCLWVEKCHILAKIMDTFKTLDEGMFKDHMVNLQMMGVVTYCPKYVPDPMVMDYED